MFQISLKQMFACLTAATVTFAVTFWILAPKPPVEKTVARLIEQASGQHMHWGADGEEMTFGYMCWHEGYQRLYAIKQLRLMGREAKKALPFLNAQITSGIENIDTGDGVIHLRDEVERAIRAIERN